MEIRMGLIMGGTWAVIGTIEVCQGDRIEPGQTLLNTETEKGNRPFKSMAAGMVTKICVQEGCRVQTGDVLFEYVELEKGVKDSKTDAPGDNLETASSDAGSHGPGTEYMETDVAIIGAGPGGYVTALYAAGQGLRTVLVERGQLGGTCLNRGCIPTKALLQSAHLYDAVKRAGELGIHSSGVTVDMNQVFDRVDRICGDNRRGIRFLLETAHVTLITGVAQVVKDRRVMVNGAEGACEIRAGHVVIAAGSRAAMPSWARIPVCMDSTQALESRHIPPSVIIIGAGVIGMEFAFLYAAFGSKIHVIESMDHILGDTDTQAAAEIADGASGRGIEIHLSSRVTRVMETESKEAVVFYEKDGKEHVVSGDRVLVAVGRVPELDQDALEGAGIRFGKNGIGTDENYETSVRGVYAIGDVNGRFQLAHAASAQGIQVINRILEQRGTSTAQIRPQMIPSVIFTWPEIGSVGKSENQCREEKLKVKVSVFPFSANGKARIQGETRGFVKLIMEEQSRRLLGGVVVGQDAPALISCIAVAVTNHLTDKALRETVFAHPTTSEAVWESAMGLSTGCIHYHE